MTGISAHETLTILTHSSTMLPFSAKIGDVYDRYHDPDDLYLYLVISIESSFGSDVLEKVFLRPEDKGGCRIADPATP